jgi:biotin-(acetyl-CoA carboxylase) ligase
VDRDALLDALLGRLDAWYGRLRAEGPAPLRVAWLARARLGQAVATPAGPGVAVGLTADGALLVRRPDGQIVALASRPGPW